ncbi:MAG: hypothetical protein QOJ42_5480 [Acidobacteriaceae bacterium]|jgi:hypothetical protein|nr:hypothetical protein [Acidobacteriaceae bacterium]
MSYRGIPGERAREGRVSLEALTSTATPLSEHYIQKLTAWPLFGDGYGPTGTSTPAPTWRANPLHAIGTPILGHDVSGTGRQTLGRAMQSITTMMPVWQCGHSRRDRPVNASKRSR